MAPPTLFWRGELPGVLEIIDQRQLPTELTILELDTLQGVWDAIKTLAVRGAPAIGCAAGYGVLVGAQGAGEELATVKLAAEAAADHLATSRPTAVNLFWALERMRAVCERRFADGGELKRALLAEARAIHREDAETCRRIGAHGGALFPQGARILTHCNAGGLATAEYGTALGCIFAAHEAGKNVQVFASETRPLLQGARLTSWELQQAGVPVKVITDGMSGFAMAKGKIDAVVVGADRIAANGDVANKIGTYTHAVLAKHHGVPFYVAAPASTFDLSLESGAGIPIEERAAEEITRWGGRQIAPDGVGVWSPAFDVTPAELVTAIVTEHGVIRPVCSEQVAEVLGSSQPSSR